MFKDVNLRESLKSKQSFDVFCTALSQNFVLIGILGFVVLAMWFEVINLKYESLSVGMNCCILVLCYVVYLFCIKHWFPAWLYFGMSRNIPFFFVYSAFWYTALLVSDVLGFAAGWDDGFQYSRLLGNMIISVPLMYAFVANIADSARDALGDDPNRVPIWRPIQAAPVEKQTMLKDVNVVRSEGHYVMVERPQGSELLKASMNEICDTLDMREGMRVHRQYWVAFNFMSKVVYDNGNPRLRTQDSQLLPLSRATVKDLKLRLNNC